MPEPSELTRLLAAHGNDADALPAIFELVHDELRALARAQMARERPGHTLQATALVSEVWIRLSREVEVNFETRRHFFGAAARAMQRILTDHARKVLADKRGAGRDRMTMSGLDLAAEDDPAEAIALSDALERLEREDSRSAEVARLRLYAGLEMVDVAGAVGVSERTAAREWAFARARLTQLLGDTRD